VWKLSDTHYPLIEIGEEIGERKHRQSQSPPQKMTTRSIHKGPVTEKGP
jgi:hypothetical protein